MDWHVLLGAAAEAESQVITIVLAGVILSRTGYLSQSAQKAISQVNLYFMTPCLLFTKIASTINWDQFKAFWPIPVFFLFFSAISWAVSRFGSRLLGFSSDEEKFVTASVLFSNTNSLPMALVQSLAMSAAGSRLLRDEHDTKELAAARGISYILFYAIFGNLVRWSYGFTLLVPKDRIALPEDDDTSFSPHGQESTPESPAEDTVPREGILIDVDGSASNSLPTDHRGSTMSSASSSRTLHHFDQGHESYGDSDSDLDDEITDEDDRSFKGLAPYRSKTKGRGPGHSTHLHSISPSISGGFDYQTRSRHRSFVSSRRRSARPSLRQKAGTAIERIRQVLTPPLLTALLALVIGLVPALHELFMSPDSKLYTFVVHPIETCGAAAIPMILLCLGAQVVNFASSSSSSSLDDAHSSSTGQIRPGLGSRRRSSNNASIFPHGQMVDQDETLSSSSEEEEHDLGWLRVQSPPRRKLGRGRRHGNNHALSLPPLSTSSSSSTLFQLNEGRRGNNEPHDQDDNHANSPLLLLSSENGRSAIPATKDSSSLMSTGYRFKLLTPVGFTLIARMVLVPAICLPVILFYPGSLSPVLTMDPTFRLTLVLLVASPTAINMIQLCQIKEFFEQPMAAVLFWSYCVFGIPFILGWSMVGLWAA